VLKKQKHQWLLQHTLYTELQELILDYQLKSLQSASSDSEVFSISSFFSVRTFVLLLTLNLQLLLFVLAFM